MKSNIFTTIAIVLAAATAPATTQTPSTTASTPPPTSTIPPGYTYKAATGSYYKFHKSIVSWYVANATCASEGANLVVLNNAVEADIVAGIMTDDGDPWSYIGLRDNRPRGVMDWRTVHGDGVSEVYHEWYDGRPFNDSLWTCAYFNSNEKRLHDYPCDETLFFTCEKSP